MASRIILDPETLLAQAGEMQNLTAEYEALFSKVTGTLNDTNNHWSELLAHNFAGKISSAQQSFARYYRTSFQWGCCSKKQCYNHAVGRPVSF